MISIILKYRKLANGEYPIVLRITKDKCTKIISLGVSCKKEHWDGNQISKRHPDYTLKNRLLLRAKEKALRIVDEFKLQNIDFTLDEFETSFRGKKSIKTTVSDFWLEKISDLNQAGRTGNARAYKDSYVSFFKFCNRKSLTFREITPSELDKYETYLRATGSHDGGIGVRMRAIRALYNDAIKKGVVAEKYYPFKAYKVSKLKGKGFKTFLTKDEIERIINLDTDEYPHLLDTKNYAVFSYFMGGINFADLMRLKWEDVQNDRVNYIRSKTKGRFSIKILAPAAEILEYYRKLDTGTAFIFPILLKDKMTPLQIENRKAKSLRRYNSQLKEIASILNIKKKVTSYTFRHSFATNLKYSGISADVIGQSMGHSDVSVTQAYLKEFDDSIVDEAMKKLLEESSTKYKLLSE
ncbi:site-specific integrase [Allomuricauda sp. ARW1Y1]|jgi:site-specific recombinase XerD|uniref:site-specific integrase n=1 Tax=Allomuricauda sp. ARW1Y1 TaxID=2663843 RepID=UPI0015C7D807|nr:site-specific integrase [Muricauda sp. ARW1Y1]NYJ26617.1 site-specific recombinase XerD [Muricauda sp. ARW1Y1]